MTSMAHTDPIPAPVRADIAARLAAAEAQHDVRVLLAVESGSRAWGFPSPDSDFDARFVYVHRRDWYLAIGEQRDVIEYPIVDEIDINGWDLRKALRLFWKSNPAFVEWIQSPIVYLQRGTFADRARALLPQVYSCERGIHHYRSMARRTYREHLQGGQVVHKKYFYALRALLSVRWLEAFGTPAPIEFARLLPLLDDPTLRADVDDLLARKLVAPEKAPSAPMPRLHAFVAAELDRLDSMVPPASRPDVLPALDAVFRELIAESWSAG